MKILIGYKKDTVQFAEHRLRKMWDLGFLPFAMKYDRHYLSTKEWYNLHRTFSRPAATKRFMNPKKEERLWIEK